MYASYKIIIEIYYSHILVLCLQTLVWVLIPSTSQCEPVRFQCLITTWGDEWLLYQAALSNVKKTRRKLPSWVWIDSRQHEVSFFRSHTTCAQRPHSVSSHCLFKAPVTLLDFHCHRLLISTAKEHELVCGPHPAELLQWFSAAQCFLQTHWPLSFGELVAAWSALNALTSLLMGLPWEFFLSYDSPFHSVLYCFCQLTHPHNWFIIPKQLTQMCLFLTQVFLRLSFR